MTTNGSVLYRVADGVAFMTLNRPDVLNSLNQEMRSRLLDLLRTAASDPNVRAILLTGEGRGFCAGQDLEEAAPTPDQLADVGQIVRLGYSPLVRTIRSIEKPIVCAVNGVAAGAGANLALCCDLVIASEEAYFIQSFCRIGLVPDTGGTFFLPRLVGLQQAAAQTLLGDKISAEKAQALGMIYQVCEPPFLLSEASELARRLASYPTRALGLIKRALNQSLSNDLEGQLELEEKLQAEAAATEDFREGVRAFLEKRKPAFRGR